MNNDIINKLGLARGELEKTWIITDFLLQRLSPKFREACIAAAIPHWFNPNILAALLSVDINQAEKFYEMIKEFTFTERFGSLGYALHDLTRASIIWELANYHMVRLQLYSKCAWEYFSTFENDHQNAVEATYHLLIADNQSGFSRFKNQLENYNQQYNYPAVNSLTNNRKELVDLGLFPDMFLEYEKSFMERVKMQEKIHILHLSDIHLENENQAQIYRTQLETDLIKELKIERLEYLVVSGDITRYATENEYSAAFEMLDGFLKRFKLNFDRVVIVPGNHDLNWGASKKSYSFIYQDDLPKPLPQEDKYISAGEQGILLRDEMLYQQRFANFSAEFYKRLCGSEYPLNYTEQAILIDRSDDKILFLALNSCWQIDHHFKQRASVNIRAIASALDRLKDRAYDDWLKIAVWHHPVTGKEMMNDEFMQLLAVHDFKICMHGHIHEAVEGFYRYDNHRGIHIVGAGTFGAPTKEQISGIPLQYNLLIFDPNKNGITVMTRKKEKPDGAWSADARWGDKNDPKPWYSFSVFDKTYK